VTEDARANSEFSCHTTLATKLLQGKWRIQILCVMRMGPVRFGQLTRFIPSASKKALTANLRELESSGVVVRYQVVAQHLSATCAALLVPKLPDYELYES
jgi:DNA-binding HxlR family transcriptional regulator